MNEDTNKPMTHEQILLRIRELVARELDLMQAMPLLSVDGLDMLAKIALIIQRTKLPSVDPEAPPVPSAEHSDKALMKAAGPIHE